MKKSGQSIAQILMIQKYTYMYMYMYMYLHHYVLMDMYNCYTFKNQMHHAQTFDQINAGLKSCTNHLHCSLVWPGGARQSYG